MKRDTFSEISEKKTSKLGYLFLIALFVFLIILGQTVFQDIGRIPQRPKGPCYGIVSYLSSLKSITQKPACTFSEIDRQFRLDILVNALHPDVDAIISLNRDILNSKTLIGTNDRRLNTLLRTYNVSLQETIANEAALLDKPEIKKEIVSLRDTNTDLRSQIAALTSQRDNLLERIKPALQELSKAYSEAQVFYKRRVSVYYFKIFLLKLLFILPVFLVFFRLYVKYKKKDSPYTIIITSVFFASTILFLQIVLVFLYEVLPKQWFAQLFKILMSSPLLKYVIYYGSVFLVIFILGGIVYFIQKRIYDPQRVALRHLRGNRCPGCSFDLNLSETFCPHCGRQIKTECTQCSELMYSDLTNCPFCGTRA